MRRKPKIYTDEFPDMLIEHMEEGYSYQSFAGKVGCTRQSLYDWEKDHEEFALAKELGIEAARYWWEQQVNINLYIDKDSPVPNNTLIIFALKNRLGWRDKVDIDTDIKSKSDVTIDYTIDQKNLEKFKKEC